MRARGREGGNELREGREGGREGGEEKGREGRREGGPVEENSPEQLSHSPAVWPQCLLAVSVASQLLLYPLLVPLSVP